MDTPELWNPSPTRVGAVLAGLRDNPMLTGARLTDVFDSVQAATVNGRPDVRTLAPAPTGAAPIGPAEYRAGRTRRRRARVDDRRRRPTRRQGPTRARREPASGVRGTGPAASRARLDTIGTLVRSIGDKIIAPPSRTFRLTSRRASVPLSIENSTDRAGEGPDPPEEPEAGVPRGRRAAGGAATREHHHPVRRRVPGVGHVPGAGDGHLTRRRARAAEVAVHDQVRVRERGRRVPHRRRGALPRDLVADALAPQPPGRHAGLACAHRERRAGPSTPRRPDGSRAPARSSASARCCPGSRASCGCRRSPRSASAQLTDVYNLANSTPNIVYELLVGGILTATLVPLFVEAHDRDDPAASDAIVTVALVLLAIGTVIGTLAAPWIIDAYSGPRRQSHTGADHGAPAGARHRPPALVHAADVLLRRDRARDRHAQRPPTVRRRGLRAGAQQRRGHRDAARRGAAGARPRRCTPCSTTRCWCCCSGSAPPPASSPWPSSSCPRYAGPAPPTTGTGSPGTRRCASWPDSRDGPSATSPPTRSRSSWCWCSRIGPRPTSRSTSPRSRSSSCPHGLLAVSVMTALGPEFAARHQADDVYGLRDAVRHRSAHARAHDAPGRRRHGPPRAPAHPRAARPRRLPRLRRRVRPPTPCVRSRSGLIFFSVYLYVVRTFSSMQDTRTPFLLNVLENGVNVATAFALYEWRGVEGLAWSWTLAYAVGAVVALAVPPTTAGRLDGRVLPPPPRRSSSRSCPPGAVVLGRRPPPRSRDLRCVGLGARRGRASRHRACSSARRSSSESLCSG